YPDNADHAIGVLRDDLSTPRTFFQFRRHAVTLNIFYQLTNGRFPLTGGARCRECNRSYAPKFRDDMQHLRTLRSHLHLHLRTLRERNLHRLQVQNTRGEFREVKSLNIDGVTIKWAHVSIDGIMPIYSDFESLRSCSITRCVSWCRRIYAQWLLRLSCSRCRISCIGWRCTHIFCRLISVLSLIFRVVFLLAFSKRPKCHGVSSSRRTNKVVQFFDVDSAHPSMRGVVRSRALRNQTYFLPA